MRYVALASLLTLVVAGCGGAGSTQQTASSHHSLGLNARPAKPPSNAPWSSSHGTAPPRAHARYASHREGRADGAATRTCRRSDYRLLKPGLNGATGALVSEASVRSRIGRPCQFHAVMVLSIRHRDGSLAKGIRGNPLRQHVDRRLGTRIPVGVGGAWRNWCGSYGLSRPARVDERPYRFKFMAGIEGRTKSLRTSPPRCDSPQSPPTLQLLGKRQ
jgi:hypothetical protein